MDLLRAFEANFMWQLQNDFFFYTLSQHSDNDF